VSKIGKIRAVQNLVDSAIEIGSHPYPASIAMAALVKTRALQIARLDDNAFNDDGTIKPAIKEDRKPIAYSSSRVYSDEPIKITTTEEARKISDRVMQATITSTLNIGDEE